MNALELDHVRELLGDLDHLLGLRGNFRPSVPPESSGPLDSPEQLEELLRDLLVGVFGLEVQGL